MRLRLAATLIAAATIISAVPVAAGASTGHRDGSRHDRGRHRGPTIVDVALANPDLSVLVQAVQKAGLVEVLADPKADLTVFAPTNAAFIALLGQLGLASLDDVPVDTLKAVLLDHVVGDSLSPRKLARYDRRDIKPAAIGGLALDYDRSPQGVNDANVVATDLSPRNGNVYVIDKVLLDPDPRKTIAELAIGTPSLSILVQAAIKADLVGALSDKAANLTVFAPTNDAFVALFGQLGLSSLDDVPVDVLRGILLDHVVPKELDAVDVLARADRHRETPTLGGLELEFNASPLTVNGVNIVATDIEGSNGTVHVIDSVLLRSAHDDGDHDESDNDD